MPESIPSFAPGHRLREDAARGRGVVMGPERMFVPDETALEILRLVDGRQSLAAIAGALAARFTASEAEIAADVAALLAELRDRGVIQA
jgi:pyrroloquinoline quinone biosynthesis protein D